MKQQPETSAQDCQQWFAGGDIFYRQIDRQRLEDAVDALVTKDRGLAVIATHETVLAHYGSMVLARLRKQKKFQLEVLLPTDTDSLIERFNNLLAAMPLQQATQPADPAATVKLLVIHDPLLIKDDQWALMKRLFSDFPGVNFRLVLFINKAEYHNFQHTLDLFAASLHRWAVETLSPPEAKQLLQAAREQGYGSDVETLLLQTGLGETVGSFKPTLETDHSVAPINKSTESVVEDDPDW